MDTQTASRLLRRVRPCLLAFAAYVVTLVVSLRLLADGVEGRATELAVSLSPVIPVIALCICIVRLIRGMDEMQRTVQFEALSLSFAATALVTFSYGFLENVGFPKLSLFIVLPLMCGFWALGTVVAQLRYR
jgi:multisubunit Na+/H+ antiporter MnhF subunit